jgi:hypothetical protein
VKTTRSHGLRRVNTATMGLAAASVTGVALVSAVVAHQSTHPAASSLSTSTNSTGSSSSGSTNGSSDDGTSDDGQQAVQAPAAQAPVQQAPIQLAPQVTTRHAVTSGS